MNRRMHLLSTVATAAALLIGAQAAHAQADTVKIGVILPMTGPSASTGRQAEAAIKLWLAQSGAKAGGKKVEVIVKTMPAWPTPPAVWHKSLWSTTRWWRWPASASRRWPWPRRPSHAKQDAMVVHRRGHQQHHRGQPVIVRTSFTLPQAAVALPSGRPRQDQEGGHPGHRLRAGQRCRKVLRAGLPDLHLHDLRHSAASFMINAGSISTRSAVSWAMPTINRQCAIVTWPTKR